MRTSLFTYSKKVKLNDGFELSTKRIRSLIEGFSSIPVENANNLKERFSAIGFIDTLLDKFRYLFGIETKRDKLKSLFDQIISATTNLSNNDQNILIPIKAFIELKSLANKENQDLFVIKAKRFEFFENKELFEIQFYFKIGSDIISSTNPILETKLPKELVKKERNLESGKIYECYEFDSLEFQRSPNLDPNLQIPVKLADFPLYSCQRYTANNGLYSSKLVAPTHIKVFSPFDAYNGGVHEDAPYKPEDRDQQPIFKKSIGGSLEAYGWRLFPDVMLIADMVKTYLKEQKLNKEIGVEIEAVSWRENGHYEPKYNIRSIVEEYAKNFLNKRGPGILLVPLDFRWHHPMLIVDFRECKLDNNGNIINMKIVFCDPKLYTTDINGRPRKVEKDYKTHTTLSSYLEELSKCNKVRYESKKLQHEGWSCGPICAYYLIEIIDLYKNNKKDLNAIYKFNFFPYQREEGDQLVAIKLKLMNINNRRLLSKITQTNEIMLMSSQMLKGLYAENGNIPRLSDAYQKKLFSIDYIELQKEINKRSFLAKKVLTLLIEIQIDIENGSVEAANLKIDKLEQAKLFNRL